MPAPELTRTTGVGWVGGQIEGTHTRIQFLSRKSNFARIITILQTASIFFYLHNQCEQRQRKIYGAAWVSVWVNFFTVSILRLATLLARKRSLSKSRGKRLISNFSQVGKKKNKMLYHWSK